MKNFEYYLIVIIKIIHDERVGTKKEKGKFLWVGEGRWSCEMGRPEEVEVVEGEVSSDNGFLLFLSWINLQIYDDFKAF